MVDCNQDSDVAPIIRADRRLYVAMVLVSAAVVALQLVLMRCLSVAHWHHFAWLIISTALLGFGAGGTILTFVGRELIRRFETSMRCLLIATALAMLGAFRLAESLPIDTYQIMLRPSQAALLVGYHLILMMPFLLGALCIGLPLTACRNRIAPLYAVNLIGSGAGAAIAVGMMFLLPPERLPAGVSLMTSLGALAMASYPTRHAPHTTCHPPGPSRLLMILSLVPIAWGLWEIRTAPPLTADPYKPLAYYEQLTQQGGARHIARRFSPRGQIDVFDSEASHETLFASPQAATPPSQLTLMIDGAATAPIFRIDKATEAAVMDETPIAAIYRVFRPRRVLLLGEAGGADVWCARRLGATHITVVQPNRQIVELLRGQLTDQAGGVISTADVSVEVDDIRGYLDRSTETFDLIQLVVLESLTGGAPGMMALCDSHVATVEGFGRCLSRLSNSGAVAVVRGLQEPPRDNLRLAGLLVEALVRRGIREPANHLLQFRNYLAACTAATATPMPATTSASLRDVLQEMAMDPVWYRGMRDEEANRIDTRPGIPGSSLSHMDYGIRQILTPRRSAFYAHYAYDIRPTTDDRPFFFDFFRWQSLPLFIRSYGQHWLARLEWGYGVVISATAWSAAVAGLLILLPLLWLPRHGRSPNHPPPRAAAKPSVVLIYFTALGAGYMFLEMSLIQQFTLVLAEPIFSAAAVLSSFLVFSGAGSLWVDRIRRNGTDLPRVLWLLVVAGAAYAGLVRPLLPNLVAGSMAARLSACVLLAAVLAIPMGMPFPYGLSRLSGKGPRLLPWAWGVNGFASVVAAMVAMVVAMSFGYSTVAWMGVIGYTIAAVTAYRMT